MSEYILFMDAMQKHFLHQKEQGRKPACHRIHGVHEVDRRKKSGTEHERKNAGPAIGHTCIFPHPLPAFSQAGDRILYFFSGISRSEKSSLALKLCSSAGKLPS